MNAQEQFIADFNRSLAEKSFRKLTLGKLKGSLAHVEHIYVRKVSLAAGLRLSFLQRQPSQDRTTNFTLQEGIRKVQEMLGTTCFAATLSTIGGRVQLTYNRRGLPRLTRTAEQRVPGSDLHDRPKHRLLHDERFLQLLGVLDAAGHPKAAMGDKYRQVQQFVAIIAHLVNSLPENRILHVVDMGCGKGYLTMALHAFLVQQGCQILTRGIEQRRELVDLANKVAAECGYKGLSFCSGDIASASLPALDVLVALHACDTASDDALYRGISAGATWILVAPCCHHELRPQLSAPASLTPLLRHGTQIERISEMVTDAIRLLCLESAGYQARIQEFISLEHTAKNHLITAHRTSNSSDRPDKLVEARQFASLFDVRRQRLYDLLASAPAISVALDGA